jgi:hypothetical protein
MYRTIRILTAIASLSLLTGCELLNRTEKNPEEFALRVVRAVAQNDFAAYQALALDESQGLAKNDGPVSTSSTGSALSPFEADRIRNEFDRALRAKVVRAHALDVYRAVVTSQEFDRWVVAIEDARGNRVGLQMILRSFKDDFRVVTMQLR